MRLQSCNIRAKPEEMCIQTYGGTLAGCMQRENIELIQAGSLGLLIWSCTSGTLPFVTEGGQELQSLDIKQKRAAIASNQMPWTDKTYGDPLLNQILRLVKSCCNPRPYARPSAALVADQLRSIQNLGPLVSNIINPEEIKEGISTMLANSTASSQLSESDLLALRLLTLRGDGNAAYLLGLAIKQGRAPADDDVEQLLLVSEADGLKG